MTVNASIPTNIIVSPDSPAQRELIYNKYKELIDYADKNDVTIDFTNVLSNKIVLHDATFQRARYMMSYFLNIEQRHIIFKNDVDWEAKKQEEIYKAAKAAGKSCYSCEHLDFETCDMSKDKKPMYQCGSSKAWMTCFIICKSFTPMCTTTKAKEDTPFGADNYSDWGYYAD